MFTERLLTQAQQDVGWKCRENKVHPDQFSTYDCEVVNWGDGVYSRIPNCRSNRFSAAKIGIGAAYCEGKYIAVNNYGEIMRSLDDGAGWTRLPDYFGFNLKTYGTNWVGTNPTVPPFVFYGGQSRWLVSWGTSKLFYSPDDGNTWTQRDPFPAAANVPVITGFMFPDTGRILLFKRQTVSISDDFYATSKDVLVPVSPGGATLPKATTGTGYNPTTNRLIQGWDRTSKPFHQLERTDDQGDTWRNIPSYTGTNPHIVTWVQGTEWYLIDETDVWGSTDDGVTWNQLFKINPVGRGAAATYLDVAREPLGVVNLHGYQMSANNGIYARASQAYNVRNTPPEGKADGFNILPVVTPTVVADIGYFSLYDNPSFKNFLDTAEAVTASDGTGMKFSRYDNETQNFGVGRNTVAYASGRKTVIASTTPGRVNTQDAHYLVRMRPPYPGVKIVNITKGAPGNIVGDPWLTVADLKADPVWGDGNFAQPAWPGDNYVIVAGQLFHWDGAAWATTGNLPYTARVSSTTATNAPATETRLDDGNDRSYWTSFRISGGAHWVECSLGAQHLVTQVTVDFGFSRTYYPVDFHLEYWDGGAWQTIPNSSVTNNTVKAHTINVPLTLTDKIRLNITKAGSQSSRVAEMVIKGL